LIKHIS